MTFEPESATFLSAFTYKTIRAYIIPVTEIKTIPIKEIRIETTPIKVKLESKGHYSFLDALGHQESRNRYDIVNRFGYMGRYQFGKSTLKILLILFLSFLSIFSTLLFFKSGL